MDTGIPLVGGGSAMLTWCTGPQPAVGLPEYKSPPGAGHFNAISPQGVTMAVELISSL